MADPRDEVDDALGAGLDVGGPELLAEPHRLRAVLADLVGTPESDHRSEIDALVGAAEVAHRGPAFDEIGIAAELRRRGIDAEGARWAAATLARRGVAVPPRPALRPEPAPWRRPRVLLALGAVILIVPLVLLLRPDPGSDDGALSTSTTLTTAGADTSAPTEPPGEAIGWRADFDDAPEGVLVASRTWEIGDGRVSGTVILTPSAASGIATHRELVPVEGFVNPVFTPEPTSISGDVATFPVDQSAGPVTITFEAELTDAEPDEATVQSWYDAWRSRVNDLTPLDDQQPADATVAPLT